MSEPVKTPWHLWVVGVLGLFWNGFGAFDFTMSTTQGDAYYRASGMSDAQIAYFHAMPSWMFLVWALGTVGALLGTVLLLLRTRWAVHVFAASLAGFLMSLAYGYLLSDGASLQNPALNAAILAGCLFYLWYAWTMSRRGVLR